LEIRLKVLGPNHSDTITSQAMIKWALSMIWSLDLILSSIR
jgi:hypothetical protein